MINRLLYSLGLLAILSLTACTGSSSDQFEVYIWQSTRLVPENQGVHNIYRIPFEINFLVPGFKADDQRIFRIDYAATFNQSEVARFREASLAKEAVLDSAKLIVTDQSGSSSLITATGFYTGLLFDNISGRHSFRGFRKEPVGLQADLNIMQILDESRGGIPLRELKADEIHLIFTLVEIDPATGREEVKQTKKRLITFKDSSNKN